MGFKHLSNQEFTDWAAFRAAVVEGVEFDTLDGESRVIWRGQRDPNWSLSSQWERYVRSQVGPGGLGDMAAAVKRFRLVQQRLLDRFTSNLSGLPGMPRLEDLHPAEKVWATWPNRRGDRRRDRGGRRGQAARSPH
jgi:hypothetical protein